MKPSRRNYITKFATGCLFRIAAALMLLTAPGWSPSLMANTIRSIAILNVPDREGLNNENAQLWQVHLRAFEQSSRLISRKELQQNLADFDLLVIPDVHAFSAAERDAILNFVSNGKALLITGHTGIESSDSKERTLASSLGLKYRPTTTNDIESWAVVLDAPSRITAGLPRMQRMNVQISSPPTLTDGPTPNAFWIRSAVAKPDYGKAARDPAIVVGSYGSGKFAWMGFDIQNIGGDIESAEVFLLLTRNLLHSFSNLPTLELAPWPYPFRYGIVYSMDVEERFGNMEAVNETPDLRAITYFILTFSAGLHQNLIHEIGESNRLRGPTIASRVNQSSNGVRGEIAVHGDNHDVFKGQPYELQRKRLQRTSDYILEITGERPIGFRPPEEAYDFFTLRALVQTGFKYMVGNHNPDRAQPSILRVGDEQLVQMTILNKDDVNQVIQAGRPAPEKVLEAYLYDIDQVFNRGGLYVFNLHSQILAINEYIPVFRDVVTYTNSKNPWTVNASESYDWWLRREALHIDVKERIPGRLLFTVTNNGTQSIQDAAVNVWIPETARSTLIESPAGGRRVLDYQSDQSQIKLRIPLLKPNESVEFLVQWRD